MSGRREVLGFLLRLFLGALVALPGIAAAIDLDAAKAQGLVGEQVDGYLGPVGGASPEVAALVARINEGRRAKYREIAQRNGTTLGVVEKLAAEKAIAKTPGGQYIQLPSGQWRKK